MDRKPPPPMKELPSGSGSYWQNNPKPADYPYWLKVELWTVERGILLLLNVETLPERLAGISNKTINAYDKMWQAAKTSLKTGILKTFELQQFHNENTYVKPCDFIKWARSKKYPIPVQLDEINLKLEIETLNNDSADNQVVANVGANNNEVVDSTQRPGIYGQRDLDAAFWYKAMNPEDVGKMTNPQIEHALKTRNRALWKTGFEDWNRGQSVWKKKSPGRKPGK